MVMDLHIGLKFGVLQTAIGLYGSKPNITDLKKLIIWKTNS